MTDRAKIRIVWKEIPKAATIQAPGSKRWMTTVLSIPAVSEPPGFSGEVFGAIADAELELACVQAYNDWLIDEWAATNERFIPQCIVPLSPIEATISEIKRAVSRGHRGVIFPAGPMHLRKLPHINSSDYDPVWATCQDLDVPRCFHAGSAPQLQFPMRRTCRRARGSLPIYRSSGQRGIRPDKFSLLTHPAALP